MDEASGRIYRELVESGQRASDFAKERGLSVHRVYSIKKRAKREGSKGEFVRVSGRARATVISSENVRIEVEMGNLAEVLSILKG